MKFFIALMAFFAFVNGQHDHTCDECKAAVTQLGQYLLTDAELAAVEEALADLVCPTLPEENIEECIEGIYAYWPKIADALFNYPDTTTNLCAGIGYCEKMQPTVSPINILAPFSKTFCSHQASFVLQHIFKPKIDCPDCIEDLGLISDLLSTDAFANKVNKIINQTFRLIITELSFFPRLLKT